MNNNKVFRVYFGKVRRGSAKVTYELVDVNTAAAAQVVPNYYSVVADCITLQAIIAEFVTNLAKYGITKQQAAAGRYTVHQPYVFIALFKACMNHNADVDRTN